MKNRLENSFKTFSYLFVKCTKILEENRRKKKKIGRKILQNENSKKIAPLWTFCLNWSISDEWWSRTKNPRFFLGQTVEECGRWIFFGISFFWAWNLNHLSHPLMPFDAENDFPERKKNRPFFLFEKSQKTVSRVKKKSGG